MAKPKALVLRAAGTNCDLETHYALEQAGFLAERVHVFRLIKDPDRLKEFQFLVIPGGFSYGDDVAAGKILANQMLHRLAGPLNEFLKGGKLLLGICNGFQVLLEAGLLPGAMLRNRSLRFACRQVYIKTETTSSPYTKGMQLGAVLKIPIAHSEGNYYASNEILDELEAAGRGAFRYCGPRGEIADSHNPNGSARHIAGILNEGKNVLGMMPHPERAMETILGSTDGCRLFEAVVGAFAGGNTSGGTKARVA